MFTASHNPAPYCGIKYIPDYAGPATPEITDTIVANITGASDAPAIGSHNDKISTFDPKPEYLKFLYTLIDVDRIRSAKLKVKYDALYSTSRGYLDEVLQHCGCDLESFHTYRDVLFGGGMPGMGMPGMGMPGMGGGMPGMGMNRQMPPGFRGYAGSSAKGKKKKEKKKKGFGNL